MIDQSAAEKIFSADLSNIVRKVKAGKPLTAAERKSIAEASDETKPPPAAPERIAADQLLSLLATRGIILGDRRLRQLADQGHYPPPVRGRYELVPTILGLVNYYRTLYEKKAGTILEEELRIQIGKRKIIEVEALRAEADVEETAEVERSRIALVVMIRQKLLALPAKASSYLACCTDQKQMEIELEKQIEQLLGDLEQPAFTARPDPVAENGAAE